MHFLYTEVVKVVTVKRTGNPLFTRVSKLNYIMPPMPPMSGIPMPPPAGSGMSATTASVVKNIAATDAAFCKC